MSCGLVPIVLSSVVTSPTKLYVEAMGYSVCGDYDSCGGMTANGAVCVRGWAGSNRVRFMAILN